MKMFFLLFVFSLSMFCGCSDTDAILSEKGLKFEILQSEGDTAYIPLDNSRMEVDYRIVSGDGSASDPYKMKVRLMNISDARWQGILQFRVSVPDSSSRFFMPGFMYGRNRGEAEDGTRRMYPMLKAGSPTFPRSNIWLVRGDRVTHPVSMMFVNKNIVGISSTPYFVNGRDGLADVETDASGQEVRYNGFGCRLDKGHSAVMYTVGYENYPVLYICLGAREVQKRQERNMFSLDAGSKKELTLYLYAFPAENEEGITGVIKDQYARYHQSPRKGAGYVETVKDVTDAIYRDAWIDSVKNYSTQVYLKEGKLEFNPLASIGWTGGVEIATPLLMASIRLDDENKREQAIACIEHIVKASLNKKSGLPNDTYRNGEWSPNGWWSGHFRKIKGHSSYLAGHCTYYILKAYEYEKRYRNVEHKEWLSFVKGILDVFVSAADSEGEFPYIFSAEDGKGKEYDSFCGAWCMAAITAYIRITGDRTYLPLCKKSEQHYYRKFLSRMECYATPHDTYKAVDAEGILAYMKAVRKLHEITGDNLYLTRLQKAADYEFTFKFPYNVIQNEQPLKKLGWSSCGGTITSTCNPHIHPMSSNVLDELKYLADRTGDAYYRSRMEDVRRWSLQCHNRFDGEFDFGRKGWMTERFCYSEALLIDKYPNGDKGSVWFCFLPWGASNIIEGLCGDLWSEYSR